jgi:hypothetical protein
MHSLKRDFIIAVLKALAQVGNTSSIRPVTRLAGMTRDATVRQSANDCLPYLKDRSALEVNSLLRATSDSTSTQELLHPSVEGKDVDAEHLLRGSSFSDVRDP